MFIGEFQHNIDAKGRISVPSKHREGLGEKFFITKGFEHCLFVFDQTEWERLEEQIKELPMVEARKMRTFFYSSAIEVEPDKQGRVVVANPLREYADLQKEATFVGVGNHVEIWNAEKWNTVSEPDDALLEICNKIHF